MIDTPRHPIPEDLNNALANDFFIRFTVLGRRSGIPRTTESTFVWAPSISGDNQIFVSGYPGARDWVANARANPVATVHTVENRVYYDIPAVARVITKRKERTTPLLAFLSRWANRPGAEQRVFGWLIMAIKMNSQLHLPWWGPFYLARRIMDQMPCVEFTFTGPAVPRDGFPPTPTSERGP